jgi:uncharacterized protein (UPF0276 family)
MQSALSGVGIGLRRAFHDAILETRRRIDWLEIVPENFAGKGGRARRVLDRCLERWPIVAHGVTLSVGGPDSMDDYLAAMRPLVDRIRAPFFSDHLAYSTIAGEATFDLLPLPFSPEAVRHAAQRARSAAEALDRPLVLENITYYAEMPGREMSEAAFIRAVLEESDSGLLLDLNNLYLNATNHGDDPLDALARLPLERVRQIHLAGHRREDDVLLDTHDGPVCDPVWRLYHSALARIGPVPVLIEWDQRIPSLDRVLDEADRARAILDDVTRERSGSGARAPAEALAW